MTDEKHKRDEKEDKREERRERPAVDKATAIRESRMPEVQKKEYLRSLGLLPDEKTSSERVSFAVYARVKKIPEHLHRAMLAYPKAQGVMFASLPEWDEIFKAF